MDRMRIRDDAWLLRIARVIVDELHIQSEGTRLRIRRPRKVWRTNSEGWHVRLGMSPNTKPDAGHREVYPQHEDRKHVQSHLSRERSRLLALRCKERDNYCCQVCDMSFNQAYGRIGHNFAEAHHKQPLGELPDKVRTPLEDLITVCANCHRMLHRMDGTANDIAKLRAIVRKHRK